MTEFPKTDRKHCRTNCPHVIGVCWLPLGVWEHEDAGRTPNYPAKCLKYKDGLVKHGRALIERCDKCIEEFPIEVTP